MSPVARRAALFNVSSNVTFFKACHSCQQSKLKCDGNMKECSRCKILGLICTYKVSTAKVGRPSKSQKKRNKENFVSNPNALQLSERDYLLNQYQLLINEPESLIRNLNYQILETAWLWKWSQGIDFPRSPGSSMCTNDVLGVIIGKVSSLCVNERISKGYPQVSQDEESRLLSKDYMRNPMRSVTYIQAIVLINLWFRNFPFPTVLNRIALIQGYIDGQTHPLLYSAMFALALFLPDTTLYHELLRRKLSSIFLKYAASLTQEESYSFPSLINLQAFYILAVLLTLRGYLQSAQEIMNRAWRMAFELRIHEQDDSEFDMELDPLSRELRNNI
ncbi:uncharacterized protein VTP21DRAFT_4778 [Calcarisporiella thermophila]|uniref:uncharacterized protein n=1 Tax=Calcarisporiella thermophila TaxID=911321 RepID=UPI003742B246